MLICRSHRLYGYVVQFLGFAVVGFFRGLVCNPCRFGLRNLLPINGLECFQLSIGAVVASYEWCIVKDDIFADEIPAPVRLEVPLHDGECTLDAE